MPINFFHMIFGIVSIAEGKSGFKEDLIEGWREAKFLKEFYTNNAVENILNVKAKLVCEGKYWEFSYTQDRGKEGFVTQVIRLELNDYHKVQMMKLNLYGSIT